MPLVLAVVLGLLPGLAAVLWWRGATVDGEAAVDPSKISIAEVAVLRDGTVGATRWAFAALACRLAREGHCTLGRTRQRRWGRPAPVATVDLHADPTSLSPLEQTVLRQLGRHDTLNGFGFAGSTFRRRTLRDVRADLVDKGWLSDCRRRSNACLLLGLALTVGCGIGGAVGVPTFWVAGGIGLGVGGLGAASVRYPVTEGGARTRAAHRAYADRQQARIETALSDAPEEAAARLEAALPALVLERMATPKWLHTVADRFDATDRTVDAPSWLQRDGERPDSFADFCRTLGPVLTAMGAGPWWVNLW
jgi:hypothetical protein